MKGRPLSETGDRALEQLEAARAARGDEPREAPLGKKWAGIGRHRPIPCIAAVAEQGAERPDRVMEAGSLRGREVQGGETSQHAENSHPGKFLRWVADGRRVPDGKAPEERSTSGRLQVAQRSRPRTRQLTNNAGSAQNGSGDRRINRLQWRHESQVRRQTVGSDRCLAG